MSRIQVTKVIKYAVMPGVIPRFASFFTSGFGFVSFLMAQIYGMVRLIPADHAYLNPQNIGKFGIRHVIAEAANHLVLDKKNIDQILIFSLLLFAIVLLALQLLMLVAALIFGSSMVLAGPAVAAWPYPSSPVWTDIFVTGRPEDDIAFMLLDRVFGVPGFFNSCVAQVGVTCANAPSPSGAFPWPFHVALHQLFRFYSIGMLLIGTIVFLYLIVVVVVETATTGSPFGQRFQNVWVPIRLVVAIGLLMPLPILYPGGGVSAAYNSGQYITFAAAKYGSSLATNAWIRFNNTIYAHADFAGVAGPNPLGERETLVALPKQPSPASILEMLSLIHACAFTAYYTDGNIEKKAGTAPSQIDFPETPAQIKTYIDNIPIQPFLLKTKAAWMSGPNAATGLAVTSATSYQNALDFFYRGDVVLTFGRLKDPTGSIEPSNVESTCGEVRIPVIDTRDSAGGTGVYPNGTTPYLGTVAMQQLYFNLIRDSWFDPAVSEDYIDFVGRFALLILAKSDDSPCVMGCTGGLSPNPNLPACGGTGQNKACHKDDIDGAWKQNAINTKQVILNTEMISIWNAYNLDGAEVAMNPAIMDRGWGGAGIWFTTIAKVNGAWVTAMLNQPVLNKYPLLMEKVRDIRQRSSKALTGVEVFNPHASPDDSSAIVSALSGVARSATVMYSVYKYWRDDQMNFANADKTIESSALKTAMNMIFGTYGLFAMTSENAQTHPLSQLTTLGKGLVEASIRNIAISTGASVMGGLVGAMSHQTGALVGAASSFFSSVAFIGLTAGIVLYYIVPFLPFIYFYFAVASWVKTIFEAMVGVPLWALAHLRLDGEGLPGDSAANGYFLIFEIFVRPILTVFGLVAAMLIFTAQVRILHFTWGIVTENVGGFNSVTQITTKTGTILSLERSVVDEFFFTVTYAIVVYMMATASFKLVDTIPDNILRWAGQGVSSFGDINQDPVGELTRYAALGGMTAGREATKGLSQLGQGLGGAAGSLAGPNTG